ncbi:hypothetical protein M5K25_025869 [Dendrobium thyrsiflorum]|uniref:Protein FAR1-RELATED SEQUENCE n=1 Tax=Dendrobium thyrsiflorum TaxID=117978 RepID=A0ABD0TVV9_DENTH
MAEESPSGGHFERDLSVISVQDSSGGMSMLEPDQMVDNNSNDVEEVKGGNLNLIDVDDCKEKIQDVEDDGVPTVGMVFKTFEEVYDFYNQYARRLGFGTKIRRSWYSLDDGQCNKFMLTCCKEGKREYKNSERCSSYRLRLAARTDCQARIKVFKKYSDGMFHLTEVNLEHNHPVSPSMSRFFRSHKDLNDGAKKLPVMRGKGHRDMSLVRVDGPVSIFEVKEPLRMKDGNQMENKNYEVTYTSNELEVRCICCSFQMIGILCRHTLSVLNFLEIYEIPAHYIVERWRKDYKNIHVLPCFSNDLGANGPAERYDNLYKHCLKFMDLGASSDGLYEYALKIISEATNELFASDPTSSDIQPRACNPFNDKRIIGNENEEIYDLSELRQRSQPLKKRKELAEKTVKNSKKKVPPRKPVVACQNDVLRMAPDTPQFDAHIWTQDSISLAV